MFVLFTCNLAIYGRKCLLRSFDEVTDKYAQAFKLWQAVILYSASIKTNVMIAFKNIVRSCEMLFHVLKVYPLSEISH